VIGAIKTTKTAAEMETTGLVLTLYRAQYGEKPLLLEQDFGPYDLVAALTKDGKAITIGVVNPTTSPIEVRPALAGAAFVGNGTRYHIAGKDEFAHNFPGQPRAVDIIKTDGINPAAPLAVPALSATVFVLPLK
jgi:alpha-N-arabinofuranosidase